MFIDNLTEVAIFFGLTLLVFGDYFMGNSQSTMRKYYKSWFKEYRELMWLPPRQLFPIVWIIMYILIEISLYIFYKNVFTGEPAYVVPAITLLFIFNILANKQWSPVFIEMRMTGFALLLILVIIGTGIAMLIIFGLNSKWIEFYTFMPYIIWSTFALYLNARVLQIERMSKKEKKRSNV